MKVDMVARQDPGQVLFKQGRDRHAESGGMLTRRVLQVIQDRQRSRQAL